jgi:hypothetical protein
MDPNEEEAARFRHNRRLSEADAEEGYYQPSEEEEILSRIPLIGGGIRSGIEEQNARADARRNRAYWDDLVTTAPSMEDLFLGYELEEGTEGAGSEWDPSRDTDEARRGRGAMNDALSQMEEWSNGGLTDSDMAMMGEARRSEDMMSRADREAALSAMEARGMGGSGSELAASLSAGEGAATRASTRNTGMMAAAQDRQYQANRDAAALGGTMRDADARERSGREAYNTGETAAARDLESRNTTIDNRGRDRRGDMAQQQYENRERAVAGITNQYSTDAAGRRAAGDERDEDDAGILGAIEGLLG